MCVCVYIYIYIHGNIYKPEYKSECPVTMKVTLCRHVLGPDVMVSAMTSISLTRPVKVIVKKAINITHITTCDWCEGMELDRVA